MRDVPLKSPRVRSQHRHFLTDVNLLVRDDTTMTDQPTLSGLFRDLHDHLEMSLKLARDSTGHPTTKGDATEDEWVEVRAAYIAYLVRRNESEKS